LHDPLDPLGGQPLPTLFHYDAACRALAEAVRVDEVKNILDVAVAMRVYAKQAKNREAEANAIELRMRATRRLDKMIQAQKETVGLAKGGQPYQRCPTGLPANPVATLAMQGIDKNLAHRARVLGAMSDEKFEQEVQDAREHVAVGKREILQKAKVIRARQKEERYEQRVERLAEICKNNNALPSGKRYPVTLADPAWTFEVYDPVTGVERTPDSHYPTMTVEEISALPVSALAADDAVLFLWSTAPHLKDALRVIEAWGFEYKTHMVWVKDRSGLGFYVRNQHEPLLIATRGKIPCPSPSRRSSSVIHAPRREHSRKPDEVYDIIERAYPELPKIELFARHARPGWACWGKGIGRQVACQ
jgi:N6-adenosine-specific RNA methylase IME4